MQLQARVISLARTPERLEAFRQRFALASPTIAWAPGVDGACLELETLLAEGVVDASAMSWPVGQLGCGLSHLACWRECVQLNQSLLIFEDDAVPAVDWQDKLSGLVDKLVGVEFELLLLGWNLDSCTELQWAPGHHLTSLYRPRYPDQASLASALASVQDRQWLRLMQAFGLAAYIVSPKGARALLDWALPLRSLTISNLALNAYAPTSLDGQLNGIYQQLQAWACFPPLIVGSNDQAQSQTKV